MRYTGVHMTPEQIQSVKDHAKTPMIMLQCGPPQTTLQFVHSLAIAAGLPEIEGYYGADLRTGEFVSS